MCLPLKLIARQESKNVDGVVIKLRVPPLFFSQFYLLVPVSLLYTWNCFYFPYSEIGDYRDLNQKTKSKLHVRGQLFNATVRYFRVYC